MQTAQKLFTKENGKTFLIWNFGAFITAVGAYFFKYPNHFSVGGVSGITVVLGHYFPQLSLSGINWALNLALLVLGLVLIGICFGTFMGVFPGFCTDQFGTKNNTVNYGIMWIGFCLAGIVGPTILSSVYSATGTYVMAFVISICIAVVGLILTFVYRAMNKKAA